LGHGGGFHSLVCIINPVISLHRVTGHLPLRWCVTVFGLLLSAAPEQLLPSVSTSGAASTASSVTVAACAFLTSCSCIPSNSVIRCTTSSMSQLGVDAPAVTPTLSPGRNQRGSISIGRFDVVSACSAFLANLRQPRCVGAIASPHYQHDINTRGQLSGCLLSTGGCSTDGIIKLYFPGLPH
jgi:hypothetical protein